MDGLLYADIPGYAALLLRRTYADLSLPGALMDRAHDWLGSSAAKWSDREKTWTFPSGATLTFGYLAGPRDHFRYQGAEFQKIGFDELTQFSDEQYRYLLSRLRRLEGARVPVGATGATNPGDIGHQWVYERFVVPGSPRLFVPALLEDNPHLDREEYEHSLAELNPITYAQLRRGLWVTDERGKPFKRDWWRNRNRYSSERIDEHEIAGRWIHWDTALKDKKDNAYNACVVFELLKDYQLRVRYVWRDRMPFPNLVGVIGDMARRWDYDQKLKGVVIEDAASAQPIYQTVQASADEHLQGVLALYRPSGSKEERWQQAAVWCKRDCVQFPHPSKVTTWLHDFEEEVFTVPDSTYKDQADAFAQGIVYLEHLIANGYHSRKAHGLTA